MRKKKTQKIKKVLEYPLNIVLIKEETRADAPVPQEDKYPSGKQMWGDGLMWEHTVPKVGEDFNLMAGEFYVIGHTSRVQEILEETDEMIRFKTTNSIYRIEFKNSE